MPTAFDEMDEVEIPEPLWASFQEDGSYVLENEEEGISRESDEPLVGVVQEIKNGVGDDGDSRIYTMRLEDVDRPVKFWGKADLDRKMDFAGVGAGDEVGVRRTGEETDVGQDSPMQEFQVKKA